jgi:type VI secretion system secreted protein Hcp
MKAQFIIAALATLLTINTSFARTFATMKINGTKQGMFKGDSLRRGKEDFMEISGFQFEEVSPRDASTGQATGKHLVKPVTITKPWSASSNQIFTALAMNEVLKEVRIEFYTTGKDGADLLDHTVVLTDAGVSDARDTTTLVNGDLVDTQTVSFTFRKIQITDKSGVVFNDDFNTPN